MKKPTMNVKALFIICLSSMSCACSHQTIPLQTIPLQTIYSSNNCAISERLIKTINSASELDQLLKAMPRNFSNKPAISPAVDYQKQSLIIFALGQQTSGGYAIKVENNVALVKGQKLYLPIRVQQPDKKGFQAQLITSPCRIFSVPKTDFTEIHLGAN